MRSVKCLNEKMLELWDKEKNVIDPEGISMYSEKLAWWKCKNGHEWEDRICNRVSGKCPYCTNRKACLDNCLATTHKDILSEWNYEKNTEVDPHNITYGSDVKVWWKCKNCHEWEAIIYSRAGKNGKVKNGCPYCSNRKINSENNLNATHPKIALEWNYERNPTNTSPCTIPHGSIRKIWWKCQMGHEWIATANVRTFQGTGCPYCAGLKFHSDFSLPNVRPDLLKEWDYELNMLNPNNISYNSKKIVFWKCSNGHKWKTKVSHRNSGSNCPSCSKITLKDGSVFHSQVEALLAILLNENGINFTYNQFYDKIRFGRHRYDFYIPSCNLYIETTSFTEDNIDKVIPENGHFSGIRDFYKTYFAKIRRKQKFVETTLMANFILISHVITQKDKDLLSSHRKYG